ncbi:Vacuolar protein sorting-associated protein 18 -like protein [Trichinella murrelli]|uniref:Vacuolar protein sorting-associated protein 18-like protein n=1 Tax=Trichinella murrelli TaxID=144512 RepID=A0A0V0U6Y5_9BILA|nr:Vacuolar protein sorting-associated protein 18 -like protein [Trichinella murrelli]
MISVSQKSIVSFHLPNGFSFGVQGMVSNFEVTVLKLLHNQKTNELKSFLLEKLKELNKKDEIWRTLIVTWLMQIHLSELRRLNLSFTWYRISGDEENSNSTVERQPLCALDEVKDVILAHPKIFIEMMSSYGEVENLMGCLQLLKNYVELVPLQIQHKRYEEALDSMISAAPKNPNVYLSYFIYLIDSIAYLPSSKLELLFGSLGFVDLLPPLYRLQLHEKDILRIIGYVASKENRMVVKNKFVQNYIFSVFARFAGKSDADLKPFLEIFHSPCFDIDQALMLVGDFAGPHMVDALKEWQIYYDKSKSQELFPAFENEPTLFDRDGQGLTLFRQQLEISGNIPQSQTASSASSLFSDTEEGTAANLQELVSQFPESTISEDAKDKLLNYLTRVARKVDDIQKTQEEIQEVSLAIKQQLEIQSKGYNIVKPSTVCSSCGSRSSQSDQLLIFPCLHEFHSTCFEKEINYLRSCMTRKNMRSSVCAENVSENINYESESCPFCGDYIANVVDVPFLSSLPDSTQHAQWTH